MDQISVSLFLFSVFVYFFIQIRCCFTSFRNKLCLCSFVFLLFKCQLLLEDSPRSLGWVTTVMSSSADHPCYCLLDCGASSSHPRVFSWIWTNSSLNIRSFNLGILIFAWDLILHFPWSSKFALVNTGAAGGELIIFFHRLFSAAIYSDKWRDKLGTSGAGPGHREEVWDKEGASWPNVTCY